MSNKPWLQRDIPPLMRELCTAARYQPPKDSLSVRLNLMLRIGALSDSDWQSMLSEAAQRWYNAAVAAHEKDEPLPGFGDNVEFKTKPPTGEPKATVMVRMLVENPDATWMEYQDACIAEGVTWNFENWPRAQKSIFRTFLSVLEDENCLNDEGKRVLHGKLLGGNKHGKGNK